MEPAGAKEFYADWAHNIVNFSRDLGMDFSAEYTHLILLHETCNDDCHIATVRPIGPMASGRQAAFRC